ncbi:MAG: DNA-binding protein [Mycoplasmataceae bacterium]|jgi:predicted DNA-binding protein YlxM (UPF0122 family)|nr:DNA-binding protein [Mycoplasmataceae bacterium]
MKNNKQLVKYSKLLQHYRNLFTTKQLEYLDDYFNGDLSFYEIAKKFHVSPTAVHDSIDHSKQALLHYEKHLQICQKSEKRLRLIQQIKDPKIKKALTLIEK